MAYGEAVRALELLNRWGLGKFMEGSVVDLGCGPEPVLPGAIGVNCNPRPGVNVGGALTPGIVIADVDPEEDQLHRALQVGGFDTVFSSHCLEHVASPILRTLAYWIKLARVGGFMVLYLPDERHYRFDPARPEIRNPEHLHYLTMETFEWYALQLQGAQLRHLQADVDVRHGRYSFLAIFERIA